MRALGLPGGYLARAATPAAISSTVDLLRDTGALPAHPQRPLMGCCGACDACDARQLFYQPTFTQNNATHSLFVLASCR